MNKKKVLSNILSSTGLLSLLKVIDAREPSLKVLAYHRVMDIDSQDYLFDENLVDASVSDFDKQMAYLSANYTVLPLSEAFPKFQASKYSDVVSLTFDDGFDDLYYNIFPILKKYNIRPTIFITTGLIGTERTLWSEVVVHALKSSIGKTLSHELLFSGQDVLLQSNNIESVIGQMLRGLKRVANSERITLIDDLLSLLECKDFEGFSSSKMMTWEMVREMAEWGVEFGSHSVSHPVLSSLTPEELKAELEQSKNQIESEIGVQCKVLAYPVGGVSAFNAEVEDIAANAGYLLSCCYLSGVVYSKGIRPHQLKRLHVDRSVDLGWFKGLLAYPKLLAADFIRD